MNVSLYGLGIAYVITAAISMRCVQQLITLVSLVLFFPFPCSTFPTFIYGILLFASKISHSYSTRKIWRCSWNLTVAIWLKNNFINLDCYVCLWRRAIQKSNCSQDNGNEVTCGFGDGYFMLIFGAMQVLLSQIPNFHNIQWLSILAAIMSFAYAFIGMGLSVGQVTGMLISIWLLVSFLNPQG